MLSLQNNYCSCTRCRNGVENESKQEGSKSAVLEDIDIIAEQKLAQQTNSHKSSRLDSNMEICITRNKTQKITEILKYLVPL